LFVYLLDNAYLHPCALETMQLTAWIPLINATKENGCMQVDDIARMIIVSSI